MTEERSGLGAMSSWASCCGGWPFAVKRRRYGTVVEEDDEPSPTPTPCRVYTLPSDAFEADGTTLKPGGRHLRCASVME
jgi:hypothetical protein